MNKAGFWSRFFAAFIDGLLMAPFSYGLMLFVPHTSGAIGWLISIVYETVLLSQWNGQTIGKKVLGIRVTTTSGGSLDWMKAFIRSISKILSALVLLLGYFWMLWDGESQTWHDKIADTIVVKA
ncbi:MAG TPA: RDD family protein [bacterium]